jgi:Sulfotransferase domain
MAPFGGTVARVSPEGRRGKHRAMRQPDFFTVGAPKSGTTALHTHLRAHPDFHLAERKDRPFFGSDLEFRRWRLAPSEYEADIRAGEDARVVGHTCVWYLYSRRAAVEIHSSAPEAQIVIMLRNPVDMLHAQHSQFLYNGNEDIAGFEAALAAQPDRRRGRRIPRRAHFAGGLQYVDTARYADQVERYLRVFGRDRVRVILYEDFQAAPAAAVADTARWLGGRDVPVAGGVVNENRRVRSRRLQAFLMSPPAPVERAVHAITPRSLHGRLAPWLIRRNVESRPRDPLPDGVRRRIAAELDGDIRRLEDVLDRDLSAWREAAPALR